MQGPNSLKSGLRTKTDQRIGFQQATKATEREIISGWRGFRLALEVTFEVYLPRSVLNACKNQWQYVVAVRRRLSPGWIWTALPSSQSNAVILVKSIIGVYYEGIRWKASLSVFILLTKYNNE